jgi:hypothetical protein
MAEAAVEEIGRQRSKSMSFLQNSPKLWDGLTVKYAIPLLKSHIEDKQTAILQSPHY